jgi:hypothetical protein
LLTAKGRRNVRLWLETKGYEPSNKFQFNGSEFSPSKKRARTHT